VGDPLEFAKHFPSELEMLEAFSIEPEVALRADGYWKYRFSEGELTLAFSFNIFEASVQTLIMSSGRVLQKTSHEGAISLKVANEDGRQYLLGHFRHNDLETRLKIMLQPSIYVEWVSLIK
jgi:hypothetical protein